MKRKLIATAALTLLLCGCNHKTEVREKGFVRTIGCDYAELQSIAVRFYGQEEVLRGTGETIFSAIEDAETTQGKTFFTGHLELLVLSPKEIKDKLSTMIKNNRISPSCSFLITPENASEIVADYKEERLADMLESSSRKGKIVKKTISSVLNDLLEEDSMGAVPILNDGNLTMAVVNYDSIVGILSEEESEGYCWLTSSLHDIILPIEVNGKELSFHIRKSNTKIKTKIENENIIITTEIKINGNCIEEGVSEKDATKAAAEKISGLCSKTISKTVTGMNADIIGIEKSIASENIKYGKSWNEIIPKLQFYYSIKIGS